MKIVLDKCTIIDDYRPLQAFIAWKHINNPETSCSQLFRGLRHGGEREIRTLGRVLAVTRFPVVRLRPAQPSLRVENHEQKNGIISRIKCQLQRPWENCKVCFPCKQQIGHPPITDMLFWLRANSDRSANKLIKVSTDMRANANARNHRPVTSP